MSAETEDITGFTRDMVAASIKAALEPMIGQPITRETTEVVRATVTRKLHEFWAANDVDFPMPIHVTAEQVRKYLESPPSLVPGDARLWLLGQTVGIETDHATRAMRVYMEYEAEWRHDANRWQATQSEAALGMALEGT